MIPKIIHYCWFGGKPLPADAQKCIASWRKHLPDYEIKEWNESNFDVFSVQYVREAYDAQKFAFVSDYVRLYALLTEGGIYFDTDVEVLGNLDDFLQHIAFSGFENNNYLTTAVIGAEKGADWIDQFLSTYQNRPFIKSDGTFDTTTNTNAVTHLLEEKGLTRDNTFQDFPGLVTIYPSEYFCPKDHATGQLLLTENTVCIHHFAGLWLPKSIVLRHKLKVLMVKVVGTKVSGFISRIINRGS